MVKFLDLHNVNERFRAEITARYCREITNPLVTLPAAVSAAGPCKRLARVRRLKGHQKILMIETNLRFDRKNEVGRDVGQAKFVA